MGTEAKHLSEALAGTQRRGAKAATTRGAAVGRGVVVDDDALLEAVLPLEEHTPPRGARKTVDMMSKRQRSRGWEVKKEGVKALRGGGSRGDSREFPVL